MNKGGCETGRKGETPNGGCKVGKKAKYRVIKRAKASEAAQKAKRVPFRVVKEAPAKVRTDAQVADFLGDIEKKGRDLLDEPPGYVFNKKRIETDNAINSASIPNREPQIGVLPANANQMDFFDLMNLLPGDIKQNIGGQVKEGRQITGAQFLEADLGDDNFYEIAEEFPSNYMDSMNYTNDYSDFLTDREERFYKMAKEKADYNYGDIQNVLTEKQFGKFETLEEKLMQGTYEKQNEYKEELNNKFLSIQGGTMFATAADALEAYTQFIQNEYDSY